MDPSVTIRRIAPGDGPLLRDLRLRSLSDSPDAFGQPLEEAAAMPPSDWDLGAERYSQGSERAWFIATTGSGTVGVVQGRRRRPSTLLLFSMWVDPAARRVGVGGGLIDTLEAWGAGWGAKETILWVYGANRSAIAFYRDMGFEIIHAGQDADSGARFGAHAMRRAIVRGRR